MFSITLFVGLFYSGLSPSYAYGDSDFEIRMVSDNGEYIGQGKTWYFSDDNGDFIDFRKNYDDATDKGYQFSVTSFDLTTPLTFTFESSKGDLPIGIAYPAKRFPFNDIYHGIDISGDGRGCNTVLGGFYVHEFELTADKKLKKAAIDFVQYCEAGTAGLYGSLRYNSTVENSCTHSSCEQVKKLLLGDEYKSTTSAHEIDEEENVEKTIEFLKDIQKKYPLFYEQCIANALLNPENLPVVADGDTYFNSNACGSKYITHFNLLNKTLEKVFLTDGSRNRRGRFIVIGGGIYLLCGNFDQEDRFQKDGIKDF